MPTKKPQDRMPKAAAITVTPTPVNVYTFTWEGVEYSIQAGETAMERVPGRALRDAFLDGDEGQMRLAFTLLEYVDSDPGALDALYAMPAPMMLDHVTAWMTTATVTGEPSLGESVRS